VYTPPSLSLSLSLKLPNLRKSKKDLRVSDRETRACLRESTLRARHDARTRARESRERWESLCGKTSGLPFPHAMKSRQLAEAELVFIRVSLKSRFSERLSLPSRPLASPGAFCASSIKPDADFRTLSPAACKRDGRLVGPRNPTRRPPIHPRFYAEIVPTLSASCSAM